MANRLLPAIPADEESTELYDAWKIAKDRFLQDLDASEVEIFNEATLENIFYTSSNTNRADQKSSKARSALGTLQPLLSAISDYGKALDVFTSIAPLYLGPIWGSIRVVLIVASIHSRFYDRIVDTFSRIGDVIPRFRDYQVLFDGRKHQRFMQTLSAAYVNIIELCRGFRSLLLVQKKSSIKRIFQPMSPALTAHLDGAVAQFRQHRKNVDKEAEVCHMIEAKEARDLVVRNNEAAEARDRVAKQKRLLQFLSPFDHKQKHRRMQRVRHPGTGQWFIQSTEFQDWLNCDTSAVVCCYGIPGCGKSVLTSSLIDQLNDDHRTVEIETPLAHYYCDYADARSLDPINIFSSILHQLLKPIGELPTSILDLLDVICPDEKTTRDMNDLVELLVMVLNKLSTVFIFLDGVDEVSEPVRKLVFSTMCSIQTQSSNCSIKLFVTSREDVTLYLESSNIPLNTKVRIGAETIAGDVDNFVKHTVHALIRSKELAIGDAGLEGEICAALCAGAKGMFLWVRFQLNDICMAETDESVRQMLLHLPQNLEKTYDRLLSGIETLERREYCNRLFAWIIAGTRPLHIEEIREAISFTADDTSFDSSKLVNEMQRLIRSCGNLVMVDEDTGYVQLAHYTVQQYLLDLPTTSVFHYSSNLANATIGHMCVVSYDR